MRTQSSEDVKRFFKLFTESTFEVGSRREYENLPNASARTTRSLLFHSLYFLLFALRLGDAFGPNSPLLVMLQFVNPNELFEGERVESNSTPPLGQSGRSFRLFYPNQLILKQLVEHGANVNAVSIPDARRLHTHAM
jgi:hypothetical protein